ncbi:hypothetical protein K501DRAFT_273502 [Backusella circina FSU 941]|nr:hypothetical protein K501DRAFT_273502 [Backusella circina FSU 941]
MIGSLVFHLTSNRVTGSNVDSFIKHVSGFQKCTWTLPLGFLIIFYSNKRHNFDTVTIINHILSCDKKNLQTHFKKKNHLFRDYAKPKKTWRRRGRIFTKNYADYRRIFTIEDTFFSDFSFGSSEKHDAMKVFGNGELLMNQINEQHVYELEMFSPEV